MLFDANAGAGERLYDLVGQGLRYLRGGVDRHPASAPAGGAHHLQFLAADLLGDDLEVALVDDVVVRRNQPRDDGLPEPQTRVYHHSSAIPGDGVCREEHARRLGPDHALDDDGEGHALVRDGVALAIGDGAVGPQGRPAAANGLQESLVADDVQVGLLLPGEGGFGQVFRGRRRAHREGNPAEPAGRFQNGGLDVLGHARPVERLANGGAGRGQPRGVVYLQATQQLGQARREVGRVHEAAIGCRGDTEAVRNDEPRLQQLP
mgnify:CR=1 FL=1